MRKLHDPTEATRRQRAKARLKQVAESPRESLDVAFPIRLLMLVSGLALLAGTVLIFRQFPVSSGFLAAVIACFALALGTAGAALVVASLLPARWIQRVLEIGAWIAAEFLFGGL